MDYNRLQNIKCEIESMNLLNQQQILKILLKDKISISENNNGSFINLSSLNESIILKLEEYLEHYNYQENNINNVESKKNNLKQEYFNEATN